MAVCWAVLGVIAVCLVRRNPNMQADAKLSDSEMAAMLTLGEGLKH